MTKPKLTTDKYALTVNRTINDGMFMKNYTQTDVCEKLKITRQTFTAKKKNPYKWTLGQLYDLSVILGKPISDFVVMK